MSENKLYVGNLSFKTTEEQLAQLFSEFGTVGSASIVTDRETGRSRGFAFVEMGNDEQAKAAISARYFAWSRCMRVCLAAGRAALDEHRQRPRQVP